MIEIKGNLYEDCVINNAYVGKNTKHIHRGTKLDMVQWLSQAGASCLLLGGSIADQIDIVWEDFPALGRVK